MNPKLRAMLQLQWQASRWPMAPVLLLCVGVPFLMMRAASGLLYADNIDPAYHAMGVLSAVGSWAPLFPIFAALVGATAALTAWALDHRVNHIYALSLPVSRAQYTLMKFAAGLAPVLVVSAALLVSTLIATSVHEIPEGLTAYPFSLGARFLFAALVAYAALFAMAAGTMRTTVLIILGIIAFFILGDVWVGMADVLFEADVRSPFDLLLEALVNWPGPLNVFGGSWMMIDV